MFADSPHYRRFSEAILTALKTETDTWNAKQLCGLAKEMAAHGDAGALQALRDYVIAKAGVPGYDDWLGADEWIELRGIDGVVELARIYGERLTSDPDDYPYDLLLPWDETWQGYKEVLSQYALRDEKVKAYCEYLERAGIPPGPVDRDAAGRESRRRFRESHSLEQIVADAYNGVGSFPATYGRFGCYASPEELDEIYTILLDETEDSVRVRLLWIFRRTAVPRLSDVLFDWANGPAEELRAAAIAALSQVSDARVHQLARSKLQAGALSLTDDEVLDLFLHNYQHEDAELIIQSLASSKPEKNEVAHSLAYSIVELADRHEDSGLVDALKWAYENTPCAICRHRIIVSLDRFLGLDDALVHECLHDAEAETRAFAQKYSDGKPPNHLL